MITAEQLRELLSYDPETGIFKWRNSGHGRRANLIAGRVNTRGVHQICIDYRKYASHRLAWLYMYGEWPKEVIDHRNRIPADNRLLNLRKATRADNARNRKRPITNKCGYKGVYRNSPGTWRAQIKVDGVQHVLGWFKTPEEGHAAYCAAASRLFGPFASSG